MAFLTLILWPFVQLLGADSWHVREWSQRALAAVWPASEAVLVRGQYVADPEIRQRCQQALTQARQYQPKGMRGFTVLVVPTELEAYCLGLVVRDHEKEGLPWASQDMHEHWDNVQVRRELQRLNEVYGLTDWAITESPYHVVAPWVTYSDKINGMDDLRFRFRGLPTPSEWYQLHGSEEQAKRLWAIKKVWRAQR